MLEEPIPSDVFKRVLKNHAIENELWFRNVPFHSQTQRAPLRFGKANPSKKKVTTTMAFKVGERCKRYSVIHRFLGPNPNPWLAV